MSYQKKFVEEDTMRSLIGIVTDKEKL